MVGANLRAILCYCFVPLSLCLSACAPALGVCVAGPGGESGEFGTPARLYSPGSLLFFFFFFFPPPSIFFCKSGPHVTPWQQLIGDQQLIIADPVLSLVARAVKRQDCHLLDQFGRL